HFIAMNGRYSDRWSPAARCKNRQRMIHQTQIPGREPARGEKMGRFKKLTDLARLLNSPCAFHFPFESLDHGETLIGRGDHFKTFVGKLGIERGTKRIHHTPEHDMAIRR